MSELRIEYSSNRTFHSPNALRVSEAHTALVIWSRR